MTFFSKADFGFSNFSKIFHHEFLMCKGLSCQYLLLQVRNMTQNSLSMLSWPNLKNWLFQIEVTWCYPYIWRWLKWIPTCIQNCQVNLMCIPATRTYMWFLKFSSDFWSSLLCFIWGILRMQALGSVLKLQATQISIMVMQYSEKLRIKAS